MKIALWNANGLSQHYLEVKMFLAINEVDIFLVLETHFTKKTYFNIPKHNMYQTMHPDGTAHGGSAIFIKEKIRHYKTNSYQTEKNTSDKHNSRERQRPAITISTVHPS